MQKPKRKIMALGFNWFCIFESSKREVRMKRRETQNDTKEATTAEHPTRRIASSKAPQLDILRNKTQQQIHSPSRNRRKNQIHHIKYTTHSVVAYEKNMNRWNFFLLGQWEDWQPLQQNQAPPECVTQLRQAKLQVDATTTSSDTHPNKRSNETRIDSRSAAGGWQ